MCNSPSMLECPLCFRTKKVFYCRCCINQGDFSRSSAPCGGRFAEKHLRVMSLKKEKKEVELQCEKLLESRLLKIRVLNSIDEYKERIKLYKCLIKKSQEGIAHKKSVIAQLKCDNEKSKEHTLPLYAEKVRRLQGFVTHHNNNVSSRRHKLADSHEDLRRVVRARVHEVIKYIFPITIVQPSRSEDSSCSGSGGSGGVSRELSEAASLAYVGGRWVATDLTDQKMHQLVAPTLPASGDYRAYNHWVNASKEGVLMNVESIEHNQEYNMSAALTYATQLVNVLAFYLDVKLPNKLCYSELCGGPLSDQKFARRVARLNLNILHLCLSQQVPAELIQPVQTMQNILLLLKTSDLGRVGPIEADPAVFRMLEDQLRVNLDVSSDDSCSDDDSDQLNLDWEAVPHVTSVDMSGPHPHTTGATSSLVTSAAAGLASIWRGLTTNR